MIASSKGFIDRTDQIAGAGLTLDQGIKYKYKEEKSHYYTVLGIVASIFTNEIITTISSNVASIAEQVAKIKQKDDEVNTSAMIGYIVGEGTKLGLCGLRNLAVNLDRLKPLEGILKMMRYCKDENTSVIMDVTTYEFICSLPMSNNKAKNIYLQNSIKSINELGSINYTREQAENIGFYLYYMLRASGQHVDFNERFRECVEYLNISDLMIDIDEKYHDTIEDKTKQVQSVRKVVELFDVPTELQLNPKYFVNVINKLSYYCPKEMSGQKEILQLTSRGLESIIENDLSSGINTIGEGISFILDSKREQKDDLQEECRKQLVQNHGIEGNTADETIERSTDILEASEKKDDENLKKGNEEGEKKRKIFK